MIARLLTIASKYLFGLQLHCNIGSFYRYENRIALEQFVSGHSRLNRYEQHSMSDPMQIHCTNVSPLLTTCDDVFPESEFSDMPDASPVKSRELVRCVQHGDSQERGATVHRIRSDRQSDTQDGYSGCNSTKRETYCDSYAHDQHRGKRLRYGEYVSLSYDNAGGNKKMYTITDLPAIARLFALAWFPVALSSPLLEAFAHVLPRGSWQTLRLVESFREALRRTSHGIQGVEWNPELTRALWKLHQTRCTHADEFSQLTEEATTNVLWTFAGDYLLAPHEVNLPTRIMRSIVNNTLYTHIGCRKRVRAIVKTSLEAFANADTKAALVEAFIDYICDIEMSARRY